jgi:hypothetical protein
MVRLLLPDAAATSPMVVLSMPCWAKSRLATSIIVALVSIVGMVVECVGSVGKVVLSLQLAFTGL